jgi:hypothetical protein
VLEAIWPLPALATRVAFARFRSKRLTDRPSACLRSTTWPVYANGTEGKVTAEASGTLFASQRAGAKVYKFAAVELAVAPWYKSWPQACGCPRRPGISLPDQSLAGEPIPGQAQ